MADTSRSLFLRLPAAVLRRIDRVVWRAASDRYAERSRIHERKEAICAHYPTELGDERVERRMKECNTWIQVEFIHRMRGDLWVEPGTGFVLLPGMRYLPASLPYDYQSDKPSTFGSLMARSRMRPVLEFDRVISFRDVNEHNYFHFFNDVLTKIPLLDAAGLLDAPILIGHRLYQQPFFQAVMPALEKAGLKLIDQGRHHVRSREVVFCKSMPYAKAYLDRVLDLLQAPVSDERSGSHKVFLVRRSAHTSQRLIGNMEEVEEVLTAHGFMVCDTGQLELRQQMELLSNTRWLVTVHGAGATNMIFRRGAPLSVLELFPAETIPPHYYALANSLGHGYDGLVCGPSAPNGEFIIPLDRLQRALERLCMGA